MRYLFSISLIALLFCWGCSKEETELPSQQQKIPSYLKGTHLPRLLSMQDREDQQDYTSPYYTVSGETAYRYIWHINDEERASRPEVAYGDRVTLTFRMYVFDYKNIVFYPATEGGAITMPYYSNDAEIEGSLYNAGLTPGAWTFEPLEVHLGRTEILKGLEYALPGCRERDTVELYMTYNMAYGKKDFGIVPKESPVAMLLFVDKVQKN